jgi:antitoxin (DNA-binding transcriptional repressor) of toxin-antitoxin stability system
MKTISISELHEKTGDWVRRSVTLGPIAVTDRGKVIAQIVPMEVGAAANPFLARKLHKGYARLLGKLKGGTDSAQSVSDDRDRT